MTAESGLQLFARLTERPTLKSLDTNLFYEGLSMGDVILLSGEPSTGKSLLLYNLIARCILPKNFGGVAIPGLEASVILIETVHNNCLLKLIEILGHVLNKLASLTCDEKNVIAEAALKRLIILKTFSSEQLTLNCYALGKLLSSNKKISLVAIDTISAFYWQDVVKLNGIRKMDLYLKTWVQKIQAVIKDYGVVTMIIKPAYFQSKSHDPGLGQFRYMLELRKGETGENGDVLVKTASGVKTTKYLIGKFGFDLIAD